MRGGKVVIRLAHNQEIAGAIPARATKFLRAEVGCGFRTRTPNRWGWQRPLGRLAAPYVAKRAALFDSMRLIFAILFSSIPLLAQSAFVPGVVSCPSPQILTAVAVPGAPAGFTLLHISCLQLGPGVTINTATAPPTVTPPAPAICPVLPPASPGAFVSVLALNSGPDTPTPPVDGTTVLFQLGHTPIPGSLLVFQRGLLIINGQDYNMAGDGSQISFVVAPPAGATIQAYYSFFAP